MGMFKLKFKKSDCCKITVDVEATECSLEKMKKEALEKVVEDFKKKKLEALASEIKSSLFKQYDISSIHGLGMSLGGMAYLREGWLVDAIIKNIIDDLGLMDD